MTHRFKKIIPIALITVSGVFPVLIWASIEPVFTRLNGFLAILRSAGQISGLVGMVLFSISLILATRLKPIENLFGGLGRLYGSHHFWGGLAFILLLIHPATLALLLAPSSPFEAMLFILPRLEYDAVNPGILALAIMLALLYITFWNRPDYKTWKRFHNLLGLSFFFASLHVFFIESDISRSLPLRYYMLAWTAMGLASVAYRIYLRISGRRKHAYSIVAVNRLNDAATEIVMAPRESLLEYDPGQFVFVEFPDSSLSGESHPFSITSMPSEKNIKLVIKNLGDFTSRIGDLKPGNSALLEGPYGKFVLKNFSNRNQIWVAGGVGVTPFLGMLRGLVNDDRSYAIDFYYCIKDMSETVYEEEIRALSLEKGVRLNIFCSDEKGRITAKAINGLSGDLSGRDFLLCGPPAMMNGLKQQLAALGVAEERIHSEEFNM